jgi:hypothetical protein
MTSRMIRPIGSLSVLLLLLMMLAVVKSPPTEAAFLKFPGSTGCNTTLQRCIDNAPAGSTIRIDRNKPIQQNISIEKSITLKPAAGKEPVIAPPSDDGFDVEDRPSRGIRVRLLALEIKGTEVNVFLQNGGSIFEMSRSRILHKIPSNGVSAISVSPDAGSEVILKHNFFRTTGHGVDGDSDPEGKTSRLTILGNVITTGLPEESNSGFELESGGQGKFIVDAHSNVIYGVTGCNCGGASGVDIEPSGETDMVVNLVNNTVDDIQTGDGIEVDEPGLGGSLKVRLFNNAVTRAEDDGVNLPNDNPDLEVVHDYNLYWDSTDGNDFGDYPSGGHDIEQDPAFADQDGGDYRPSGTSPLINGGLVCNPGGLLRRDADSHVRFLNRPSVGPTVDIGAYEAGSISPPPGKMVLAKNGVGVGSPGADVICGTEAADTLKGKAGRDWIEGAEENDELRAGGGPDYISGQDGNDDLHAVDGVSGNDVVDGGGGTNTCEADNGDDVQNCTI